MSYTSQIVNFPNAVSGSPTCKDQHAAYQVAKTENDRLAAELGPIAASCHKLHGDFDSALAVASIATQNNEQCAVTHDAWAGAKIKHDGYLASQLRCEKIKKCKDGHAALVTSIITQNAATKKLWQTKVKDLTAKNVSISNVRYQMSQGYNHALRVWNEKNAKYQTYRSASDAMARSYSYGHYMKYNSRSATQQQRDYYKKYNWKYRTLHCGTSMMCMSAKTKRDNQLQCDPVRGLGAVDAPICATYFSYFTCPDTSKCPPWAPGPGTKPKSPTLPSYHSIPAEPTYKAFPTLEEFCRSKGLGDALKSSCPPISVANPGPKPGCNPNAAIPPVPPQPTCTPPEIPTLPVRPTCKPSLFEQVGPMWLLLAAGAGGVYWYSKKK